MHDFLLRSARALCILLLGAGIIYHLARRRARLAAKSREEQEQARRAAEAAKKAAEPVYLVVTPQGISDKRPIEIMTFGAEERTPDDQIDPVAQANTAGRVRAILSACGCKVAEDITKLGCTGVVAAFPIGGIDVGNFLRIGLAGGGVGLPCFVPIGKFCLVHNTIGGLEQGQKAYHAEVTEALTRDLTLSEKARVAVVERARRIDDDSLRKTTRHAADVLGGRDRGVLREVVDEMEHDGEDETENEDASASSE